VNDDLLIGASALRILADASARSVVLALLVGLTLGACRVRSVMARHAAWAVVLCGMLGIPVLTAALPGIAIPLVPSVGSRLTAVVPNAEGGANRNIGSSPMVMNPALAEASREAIGSLATPESPHETPLAPATAAPDSWLSWLFSAYLAGVAIMLGRLGLGFAFCRRLIRSSDFSDDLSSLPGGSCSAELRERLRRGRVVVGTGRATQVPLTLGWLHPMIILPEGWRTWSPAKLDAALAHEFAHVERRDTLFTLVGAVNLCIYWFHPLAWLLRYRLASLAERACDDLAITWTGQRTQYARHLLEFARSIAKHRGHALLGGLSMADGGDLHFRIEAILDRRRPLARSLRRRQLGALAVAAAVVVPSIAAIQVRGRVDAAPPAQAEIPRSQASEKREQGAFESRVLHGHVLDPDGHPFAGALLFVPFENSQGDAFLSKGRSGPDGRFRFAASRSEFQDCAYDPLKNIRLAASADGFGIGWDEVRGRAGEPGADAELTLRLVKDVPIEGRILNLEGKPVAGARLTVDFIKAFPGDDMTAYIENARNGLESDNAEKLFWAPPGRAGPIKTDELGRFRLAGVGRERLVRFEAEGPGIQTWFVFVATRMPENAHDMVLVKGTNRWIYSARFDYMANPSRPIRGTVREKGTGRPIAGADISSDQGPTLSRAKTDALGRFELLGYPKSSEYHVMAAPAEGQPFFSMHRDVPDTAGLEPFQVDFELVRGIAVRGRLTDNETGKPVKGDVEYYPLEPNPHVSSLGEPLFIKPSSKSVTDAEGNFTVVALPGPGLLAASAWGGRWDRYLAARIDRQELKRVAPQAPVSNIDMFAPVAAGGPLLLSNYNELKLIDPPDGAAQPLRQDITLRVGRSITCRVVAPDGTLLAGVRALGGTSHQFDEIVSDRDGAFMIAALEPASKRPLNLFDSARKLGLYTEVRGDQPGPLTIRLQPCGAAFGRIVDLNGQPRKNRAIVIHRDRYAGIGDYVARSDDRGVFRVDGLVPGQLYQPRDPSRPDAPVPFKNFTVGPGEAKDLGDARIE
jgi:beta-lactamase regulating signal transducer with metallopeptidase domain